jgi:hypothetical protein
VLFQVIGLSWRASPCQISRGRADGQGVVHQGAGDQLGIDRTQADGDVETVVEQVESLVGQDHVELDLWVALAEFGQGWRQELRAEGQRRGDAQGAGGVALGLLRQALGVGDQPDDFQAALIVGRAELGQALAPRRPVDQAHAEALLQRAKVIAHHGGGHLAGLGRRRQAAGFHDFHVNGHCLEQVHYQARLLND